MWIDPLESARLYLAGLAGLHLRRRIDRQEVDWLLQRSPPVEYSAGRVVLRQGEPADAALLIVHGALEVVVQSPNGTERVLGTAGPWDVLGETALYAPDRPRSATVRATRDSTALVVGQQLLQQGRDNAAVVAIEYHLLHTLTERIRVTNQALHEAWVDLDDSARTASRSNSRNRLLDLVGGGRNG
jgi:CRP-like cAMP-binding protein